MSILSPNTTRCFQTNISLSNAGDNGKYLAGDRVVLMKQTDNENYSMYFNTQQRILKSCNKVPGTKYKEKHYFRILLIKIGVGRSKKFKVFYNLKLVKSALICTTFYKENKKLLTRGL